MTTMPLQVRRLTEMRLKLCVTGKHASRSRIAVFSPQQSRRQFDHSLSTTCNLRHVIT